jgi:WD40 repeat protein
MPSDRGIALPAATYGYFAISPDAMTAAVGNAGAVDVYETSTWTKQRTLTTSAGTVYGVGYAPDGQRVISIDSADKIFIHSVTNPTALGSIVASVFDNNGIVVAPVQLSSGLGIAVPGTDGDVSLFSITGTSTFGAETYFQATTGLFTLNAAFSPNSTLLAVSDSDSFTQFWNFPLATATAPPTGATISIGSTGAVTDNARAAAFSPNGAYLAIAGGYDQGSISIWNVSTRAMVSRFNMPTGHIGLSVAFSPNGSALVVGERGCGKLTVCSY